MLNATGTKKANLDKETEMLILKCHRAMGEDDCHIDEPHVQAMIAELKIRNYMDIDAVMSNALERIIAINGFCRERQIPVEFFVQFSITTLSIKAWSQYAEKICRQLKLPNNAFCNFRYYYLHRFVEDTPDYFLTKWEKFLGLR